MATTTNMLLDLPVVTVTLGPAWATQVNEALEVVDQHDHTSDKGIRVPSAGLNINADLDFQGNRILSLMASKYQDLAAPITGASNSSSIHVASGNLYFTNASGTAVQLTDGGALVASPGNADTFELQNISSDVVIAPTDTFVFLAVDTTATRQITLPLANSVSAGRIYIVKDITGSARANNITVLASGSDTVDGDASQQLNSEFGSWTIVSNGVGGYYIS